MRTKTPYPMPMPFFLFSVYCILHHCYTTVQFIVAHTAASGGTQAQPELVQQRYRTRRKKNKTSQISIFIFNFQIDCFTKLVECRHPPTTLDAILGARFKFHPHRRTASACHVPHIFKLVPPKVSHPYAQQFDRNQLQPYSKFSLVPVSPTAANQIPLRVRDRRYGFLSKAQLVQASHGASLLVSARHRSYCPEYSHINEVIYGSCARCDLNTVASKLLSPLRPENCPQDGADLGALEPAALLQRPQGVYNFLFHALHS